MDHQLGGRLVEGMPLDLCDVVADVIDYLEVHRFGLSVEDPLEGIPHPVDDHLAVGEGHIGCAGHGPVVILPFLGGEGRAGELPVLYRNAVPFHRAVEYAEIV